MSREDLNILQLKLKATIQNHQVLVGKLKKDPQNVDIAGELRAVQVELTSLNERQKQIVLQLRKQQQQNIQSHGKITASVQQSQQTKPTAGVIAHGIAQQKHHLPPGVVERKIPVIKIHQQRPSSFTSDSSSDKTPDPNATSHTHHSHTSTHHSHTSPHHSHHGQMQISPKSGHHHGHRPSILQGSGQRGCVLRVHNDIPVTPVRTPTETKDLRGILRSAMDGKNMTPEEIEKVEYMASLNLITRDRLTEIQTRRSERKRRSTAKPQFSYVHGHLPPERKRSNNMVVDQSEQASSVSGQDRKRGRPSRASAPSPHTLQSLGSGDESCAVCRRTGQLFSCDACSRLYHHTCLSMSTPPPTHWLCPKCQPASCASPKPPPSNSAVIESYLLHKQQKEQEKSVLEQRRKELEDEKDKLEERARALTETINQQVDHKQELLEESRAAEKRLGKLKNILKALEKS